MKRQASWAIPCLVGNLPSLGDDCAAFDRQGRVRVSVPDFQSLMHPLLKVAADGREHSLAETRRLLAAQLNLSIADQEELLPSGRQSRFANRVAWAKVYLQQAGLLLSPRRGWFQISDLGRKLLDAPPERIDIKFLGQYPQFAEFRRRRGDVGEEPTTTGAEAELETPRHAPDSPPAGHAHAGRVETDKCPDDATSAPPSDPGNSTPARSSGIAT